ncbi:tyrosine recombinase XerC [Ruminococcus flavefaciens]|uniref:site-specific integrase n=1 Tax=Ruminococcus flavefaciens TaxID=1265 RepID=UPI0026F06806|nr:site-specific integrase [Ruminococcus flavefaciens]
MAAFVSAIHNHYRSIYGHSYTEVKEKLLLLKANPTNIENSCNMTVKGFFKEWLSAVKLRVKASTYANYQMKVEKHIIPFFGDLRYDMLTIKMIHEFMDKKIKAGLSTKYVSDIIIVFKSMGKYAAKIYKFRNILSDVTVPKVTAKERPLLKALQQHRLCKFLLNDINPTALCVLLSLYTGLRIGEVCGIMWSDIDFENCVITVRRTVQRIHTGNHKTKMIVDPPKSIASRRSIPVPTFIMEMLRDSRSKNNHFIISDSEIIIEPRTLQRRFKSILKKADLPSVNYHSLRHMFATNSLQAGGDVKTLSEILEHSSVETTIPVPNSNTKPVAVPTDIHDEYKKVKRFSLVG